MARIAERDSKLAKALLEWLGAELEKSGAGTLTEEELNQARASMFGLIRALKEGVAASLAESREETRGKKTPRKEKK